MSDICVIDGAQRPSHSNAFVQGFCGARKIVLFDALLENQEEDEILAIVSCELGHVVHNHILKRVVMMCIQLVIMFAVFGLCLGNKDILLSFGFKFESNFLYLLLFQNLWIPVAFVTQFFSMSVVRQCEFEADAYAAS